MPYPVNKIIHHRDYKTFYQSLEFPLEETVQFPYIAGEMQSLIPEGAATQQMIKVVRIGKA